MAAKWQQWMPFHIDRFFGSPSVQAMDPAAALGYLALLAAQWQTEDCSLSADPLDLAQDSRLGDDRWNCFGARILRCFEILPSGRIRNQVCYQEWKEAKRVFESRQASAKRTNTERWAIGDRSVTDKRPNRSAYTITGTLTGTDTDTEKQEQIPSPPPLASELSSEQKKMIKQEARKLAQQMRAAERAREKEKARQAKPPTVSDEAKLRHKLFKAAIFEYWRSKNDIDCPWDQQEGAQLEMWLKACPTVEIAKFTAMLRNRYKSDVNHSERPSKWIKNVTDFAGGPINKRAIGGFNGRSDSQSKQQATVEAAREVIASIRGMDSCGIDENRHSDGGTSEQGKDCIDAERVN